MFFKNLCVLVLWTRVASALEGLIPFGYKCRQLFRDVPETNVMSCPEYLSNTQKFYTAEWKYEQTDRLED